MSHLNLQTRQNKFPFGLLKTLHLDMSLLFLLFIAFFAGMGILYSASGQNQIMMQSQLAHWLLGFILLWFFSSIPPDSLRRLAPVLYTTSILLLIAVLIMGHIGKGAQRWLNLGLARFQPSELLKLAIPMMLAWYYHEKPIPLKQDSLLIAIPIILIPAILTAKQPDLGTAILLIISGSVVLFCAGLTFRLIFFLSITIISALPLLWLVMHDYQKQRVLMLFNPESDPLGKGYHIIQSKIALGSGGLFGKGWLHGTQSQLHFLPEHTTDSIFAVCGEELGFVGCTLLILLFISIVWRGISICLKAQDTFSRLFCSGFIAIFGFSAIINIGMVSGLLPIVGVPLPLISYGGSSLMTLLSSFGMLMSIHSHRKLVAS